MGIAASGKAYAGAYLSHVGIYEAKGTATIPLHAWVHLMAIFAESASRVRIAVSGIVEAEAFLQEGVRGALAATIGRTRIGTPDRIYFVGRLDEARISNTARSPRPISVTEGTWSSIKSLWR